jgi:hypothetical protein
MVAWWWIPVSFGIALVGGVLLLFLMNLGSFFRYLKISSM